MGYEDGLPISELPDKLERIEEDKLSIDMIEKIIILNDGSRYVIQTDDEYEKVRVLHLGKEVGHFEFAHDFDDAAHVGYWILMYMTIQHKRKGLGREILKFHKECTRDDIIISRLGDGIEWEDGSQVVDEGIPFVQKMRREGFIQK